MNDRHPSGTAHYAAHDGYSTTSFATDPLFGDLPGDSSYDTGSYDTGQWHTAGQQQYADPYATSGFDTGAFDTTTYSAAAYDTGTYDTGSYDTTAMWAGAGYGQQHTAQWTAQPYETQTFETQTFETQTFETPVFGTTAYDTGAYDATAWNSDGTPAVHETAVHDTVLHETGVHETALHETGVLETAALHEYVPDQYNPVEYPQAHDEPEAGSDSGPGSVPEPRAESDAREPAPAEPEFTSRAASRAAGRSRRRVPAKRSALLTVAVPSVCVVGVAGIAAASVGSIGGGDDGKETQAAAAPDASAVKPSVANNKLDTQLKDVSADAGDFADRASRTQERIDLRAKQEADRKKAAEEAARKEALRPKFALPVKQRGLSAYYGQAGINWMSVHSGIDFPVSYGTPVMAATDGTVRTQWNSAYGNMAIVTAKDGTETWYCHLSAHTVMSGPVKAGDVIARSGNSGNSTGPHLHFEVRPGGGSAIDPLPWLRSHGLDPT
ncbi:M23 family metallopeptidase [Streptomyces sp. YJ-C3]